MIKDEQGRITHLEQGDNCHRGHSVCNTCGKNMQVCWDVICSKCLGAFCYDHSIAVTGKWYCIEHKPRLGHGWSVIRSKINRLVRGTKQWQTINIQQLRKCKLQFSPLEDITAYELAQIIQISNSSKSFSEPVEQHCIDLFRQSKVERHWLLNGKRLTLEK